MNPEEQLIPIKEFEDLFVNNEKFDQIRIFLNRFNPIRVMGMAHMEIRHSAILAWIMDPKETHGLGDRFLKAFLAEALRGQNLSESPTALEIISADLRDAEIRREWQNIDILIYSPDNKWVFIVENKYYSSQHSEQLKKYWEKAEKYYYPEKTDIKIKGIFLTLLGETPQDPRYAPLDYSFICEILSRLITMEHQTLSTEVRHFLEHYLSIIKDATGMSEEHNKMEKLARELYRDHKKVLDFIIAHGRTTEFRSACESVFTEGRKPADRVTIGEQNFRTFGYNSYLYSFLPESWYKAFGEMGYSWEGCEGWWSGFPVICWFQIWPQNDATKGTLILYAEIGPLKKHDFRKRFIEDIQKVAAEKKLTTIGFQSGATDEKRLYSKFFKTNGETIKDTHNGEEIAAAMRKLLIHFRPTFDALGELFPKYIEEGKKGGRT